MIKRFVTYGILAIALLIVGAYGWETYQRNERINQGIESFTLP